jgi:4-hydroxybenzoate polyprenyltransferase
LLAWTTGVGWSALASVVALAALIVLYDAKHKQNPVSPLIMGLCRAAVYVTAALAVSRELSPGVLVGAGVLVAYLIGLTYIARAENLRELGHVWPLAFLAVPFFVMHPTDGLSLAIYVLFVLVVAYALLLIKFRQVRGAVTTLIAGISVLDALVIAREGRPGLALAAIGAWFLTRWLHRVVPGT